MVLMAFQACAFPLLEYAIQDFPGHDAHMRVGACNDILFSLRQHVHEFNRGIKVQVLVGGTRFDFVLSMLSIRCWEELNWAADGCLGWYHYDFLDRGSPRCVSVLAIRARVSKVGPCF